MPPSTDRGARTRVALKKSARALFEKQGFLDTSVNQISTRARVAHGTFYTYFRTKEQIFAEIASDLFVEFNDIATSQPTCVDDLSERIARANRGYLRAYQVHAKYMAAIEQAATLNRSLGEMRRGLRSAWIDRAESAIGRWQARGLVDPAIDPRDAASILGSMVDRSAYVWIVLREPFDEDKAVEQLTRLYCNALRISYSRDVVATPSGRRRRRQT